ncbi:MAG TPA: exodeoxyribonuclease VII large subunit [Solirubrobacteraceae bacterium]|jgi:exodeoxyribonuclease VII large subunit
MAVTKNVERAIASQLGGVAAQTSMEIGVSAEPDSPAGIPGSSLPGPFPVGEYAAALQRRLREFVKVQLIGELVNLRVTRAKAYFELRDPSGSIPCAAWRTDWERMQQQTGALSDGIEVVVQGGCDYYPGSATSSPSFCFSVSEMRVAGEGDLLAQIDRLRKALHAEGLLDRQRQLTLPQLPHTIGVVCSETGKARDDVLAGLHRRGWAGRVIWAFAPVQDRHAAPAIGAALRDLAGHQQVDIAIVARGGGSLADLLCFCDETLCRTVALLSIPVIASVGHHTDRTLLDDVAAVSCSTPTHAAEAAVALDCMRARSDLHAAALHLQRDGRRAVLQRARGLASLCRAPTEQVARQRVRLHQQLREARAGARRRIAQEQELTLRRLDSLRGKAEGAANACRRSRKAELERLALTLAAHDPQSTLRRGYALVESRSGETLASAAEARQARELTLRFADGLVQAEVEDPPVEDPKVEDPR